MPTLTETIALSYIYLLNCAFDLVTMVETRVRVGGGVLLLPSKSAPVGPAH